MKFSICIPVYNAEKYLNECLCSVFAQTCQDFEVILVDDGSTDDSGVMCDQYTKDRPGQIKVIHQTNGGLLCARRIGISHASGDYCIFLDSDDTISPNLIETVKNCLIEHPDVDVVLYSFQYYRNGQMEQRTRQPALDGKIWVGEDKHELYEKLLFTNDVTSIWSKAVRTSLLLEDPTDYTLYYGKDMAEDRLQSLAIFTYAKKVCYINKVLYNYRIVNGSMSHEFRADRLLKKSTLHVYEKELEYLPVWGMDTIEYRERLAQSCIASAIWEFSNCYERARTHTERKHVVDADWDSLIPDEAKKLSLNESHSFNALYRMICEKAYRKIEWYFLKNRCYRKWKEFKQICRSRKSSSLSKF